VAAGGCNIPLTHGITWIEISKLFAMAYSWNGNASYLNASINAFEMVDKFRVQMHGVISADEQLNGISPNLGTGTCDVSNFTYSNEWMMRVTGNGLYGDPIEKAAYNAGAGSVNRTYLAHVYYESPNLMDTSSGIAWFEKGAGAGSGEDACNGEDDNGNCHYNRWTFGHYHLPPCCTGNRARMLPNFIQHMFFNVYDALSKTSCVVVSMMGPARVDLKVGSKHGLVPLQLNVTTDFPFNEDVKLAVSKLATPTTFPMMLRIPLWCTNASLALNGKPVDPMPTADANGFVIVSRSWSAGDSVMLKLPMAIRATKRATFANGIASVLGVRARRFFSGRPGNIISTDSQNKLFLGPG
jgi:DUF1680 family protein